jgi:peroxin-12
MGMHEQDFFSQQQQQPLSPGSFDWRLQRKRTMEKIRSLFVLVYPYLHMTHEGTIVFYQWSYLVGRSVFYSPSLHALGMIIRRVTMADIQTQNNTKSLVQSSKELSKPKIEDAMKAARKLAGYGLVAAVMIGWASNIRTELHRRRQQWINESVSSQINNRAPNISLPVNSGAGIAVPPPQPPKVMLSANTPIQSLPLNKALCPLCRQTRVNPVASTSGYVFCYRCLVLYVRDHGTCPLTGLPCPESKLVRVYETEQEHDQ